MSTWRYFLTLILLATGLITQQVLAAPTADDIEYFEQHVRPLLAKHCFECHGPKKQHAELRLDIHARVLEGGESGPAVVPGKPDESLLIEAVRRESFEMPPEEELTADQVAILVEWVQRGAVWPEEVNQEELDRQHEIDEHWAFQPILDPKPPQLKQTDWPRNDIDRFILARLEQAELSPSPAADQHTLQRRLAWDLTGLPASVTLPSESGDRSATEFVDQLLDSPHYGERWARYWLDVARYADTKGYVFFEKRPFVWAYTYRDYVIKSLNSDKPFNQFVREQIAADLLPNSENDRSSLAALGYITVGARFKNSTPDILDDRIDVVMRGMMGLTVTCARCHDHKFDPISTEDYYSLYGVFANSLEPAHQPFLHEENFTPEQIEKAAELKKLADELEAFQLTTFRNMMDDCRARLTDYLQAAQARRSGPDTAKFDVVVDGGDLNPQLLQYWQQYLEQTEKAESPVFAAWHQLAKLSPQEFPEQCQSVLTKLASQQTANPLVLAALEKSSLTNFQDVVQCYVELINRLDESWKKQAAAIPQSTDSQASDAQQQVRQVLYGTDSPLMLPVWQFTNLHLFPDRKSQEELKPYFEKLQKVKAAAPPELAQALVLNDSQQQVEPKVFKRGNPAQPGQQVTRRFLQHFPMVSDKAFTEGSGRLPLAEALVSPDNPLTARVIVNRVWQYHFGRGLVATPSNFGLQGATPSHPELLDHLATWFVQHDWSLKSLHRYILDSATYRQQSSSRPECASIDPDNHLCWKMNRRRHDLESMRDAMLATAQQLDLTVGGPSVKNGMATDANRRTLYSYVDREDFPGVFRMFDFPNPDVSSGERNRTMVPGQTLFLMNHPLVFACAISVAQSIESGEKEDAAIHDLFSSILHREPEAIELEEAHLFVRSAKTYPKLGEAWSYGYGEFDDKKQRLASFHKLPHWTGQQWQGGSAWPDSKLGWVALNNKGGHPGNDLKHVAVARWTAPAAITVSCQATLAHRKDKGNGVRGWIAVNDQNKLGPWEVHNTEVKTNIAEIVCQAGDTIDFIVDVNGNLGYDSYQWDPTLAVVVPESKPSDQRWNYQEAFGDPVAMLRTPLQRLAQILLLTNEFQFID